MRVVFGVAVVVVVVVVVVIVVVVVFFTARVVVVAFVLTVVAVVVFSAVVVVAVVSVAVVALWSAISAPQLAQNESLDKTAEPQLKQYFSAFFFEQEVSETTQRQKAKHRMMNFFNDIHPFERSITVMLYHCPYNGIMDACAKISH